MITPVFTKLCRSRNQTYTCAVRVRTFLLALLLGSRTLAVSQDSAYQNAVAKVDTYVRSQADQGAFRGSVLVAIQGKIIFEKGYGFTDEEWGAQNGPSTRFRIASLTKQFTACGILLLQQRHLLAVTDPVSKYIPNLPQTWQSITLHQLLTHTSGIPNYTALPEVQRTLNRTGATPCEMIDLVAARPLEFKPGIKLRYTNTGYVLLGMVIEKVSGIPYPEFLNKNIFGPLGLSESGYDQQPVILPRRASGYMHQDGKVTNAGCIDMSIPYAAGSIYSTVEDMLRWNEALAHGTLLSQRPTEEMFTPYPETIFQDQHYGYGVVLAQRFGRALQYHGGGVNGFDSVIQRYPEDQLCIVVAGESRSHNSVGHRR